MDKSLSCLFVTANVGSIFEDPEQTLHQWLTQFLKKVAKLSPSFIALHCQEVGGKNYQERMHYVDDFVKSLLASPALANYSRVRVFLDEDFTAEDKFTALGNLYFIHDSVPVVHMWNFQDSAFEVVNGKEILAGNIEDIKVKEKLKFPVNYFPDCKWSRKGYLRTRWEIGNVKFDLLNIHLFHDASNLAAIAMSPSKYSNYRKAAFALILERLKTESLEKLALFIFGDFNFRLDGHQLVNKLTEKLAVQKTTNKKNGKVARLQYQNSEQIILTVESKFFAHHEHEDLFLAQKGINILEFDSETQAFQDLLEYPITFPPSYPFSEDVQDGCSYMKTRCPSWCDRILFTHTAKKLIRETGGIKPKYSMIGRRVCMGDHKPIYLHVQLESPEDAKEQHERYSCSSPTTSGPDLDHRPLKKSISVNGSIIPEDKFNETSLLQNAAFHCETALPPQIRAKQKGFRNIAQYIMMAGHAVSTWRKLKSQVSSDEEDSNDSCHSSDLVIEDLGPGIAVTNLLGISKRRSDENERALRMKQRKV